MTTEAAFVEHVFVQEVAPTDAANCNLPSCAAHMDLDRQTTRQGQRDSEVRGSRSEGLCCSGLIDLKTCFLLRKIDRGPVVFGDRRKQACLFSIIMRRMSVY